MTIRGKLYHYSKEAGRMVEGPAPRGDAPSGDGWRYGDRMYSANPWKAHDGTIIDSKARHRDYMKRHNLTTMDDYSWTAKPADDRAARIDAIKRAIDQ